MKINYEIPIIYNDLFKNESLLQAITNLEKLEQISVDVFNRINKSLMDKKTKLENLKSRINRANIIISSFENLPQALTIKSKRFYPSNALNFSQNENLNAEMVSDPTSRPANHSTNLSTSFNHQSIYYEDVCDFSLVKIPSIKYHQEINTKPSNSSNKLGKKPDGMLEDVTLYQDILNSIQQYKDITTDLKFYSQAPVFKSSEKQEAPSGIDKMSSLFQFIDKTKVYGEKKTITHEPRDSKFLNNFMKKKNQILNIKKPEEAPVSITEKVKLTKYTQKKELIRRNTNATIQLNIPKNINLPLISDFDIQTTPLEDYFAEDHDSEIYAPQETIFNDDINEFQMPLDIIKNYKKKQSQLYTNDNFGGANRNDINPNNNVSNEMNTRPTTENTNTNYVNTNDTRQNFSNTNTNTNINPPVNNSLNSNSITNTNEINSNINQNIQKQNIPSVPIVTQTVPQPQTAPKPNVPSVPDIPNSSKIPPVPKIPIPPPIPKIPAIPVNNIPKSNPNPPTEVKAVEVKSLFDEIVCENPMARLKKIGTVNVNSSKEEKKEEKKAPNQASMLDLLKKQIGIRFNKINKDTKPVKRKKKKSDDSDSFSSKNNSESE